MKKDQNKTILKKTNFMPAGVDDNINMFNESEYKFSTSKTNFIDYVKEQTQNNKDSFVIEPIPSKRDINMFDKEELITKRKILNKSSIIHKNNPIELANRERNDGSPTSNLFESARVSTNSLAKYAFFNHNGSIDNKRVNDSLPFEYKKFLVFPYSNDTF